MARSIVFHGRVIRHPGAEVFVDTSGMVRPGVDDTKVAIAIGMAPKGQPGVWHAVTDGGAARALFGDSDLTEGLRLLFNPSSDDRAPDGASLVYAMNVNRLTKAWRWVGVHPDSGQLKYSVKTASKRDLTSTPVIAASLTISGQNFAVDTFKNMIVEVISGKGKGQQLLVASSSDSGADHVLTFALTEDFQVVPDTTSQIQILIPVGRYLANVWGTEGNEYSIEFGRQPLDESYELQVKKGSRIIEQKKPFGGLLNPLAYIKFDPTGGGDLSTTAWKYPANWIIPQAQDGGNAVEGTTTAISQTVLDGATNTLTVDAHVGKWVIITGPNTLAGSSNPYIGKLYRILSNTASAVTLEYPGLGTPPSAAGLEWKVIDYKAAYVKIDGANGKPTQFTIEVLLGNNNTLTYGPVDLTKYITLSELEKYLDVLDGVSFTIGDGVDPDTPVSRFDFSELSRHYGQLVQSTIAADASVGATSITLESVNGFPSAPYDIIINPGKVTEQIVTVTSVASKTLTLASGLVNAVVIGDVVRLASSGKEISYGPGDADQKGEVLHDDLAKLEDWVNTQIGSLSFERTTLEGSSSYAKYFGSVPPLDDLDVFKRLYGGSTGDSVVAKPVDTDDPNYPISWEWALEDSLRLKDARAIVLLVSEDLSNWSAGDIEVLLNLFRENIKAADDARAERQGFMGFSYPLESGTYNGVSYKKGLLDLIRESNNPGLSIVGQTTQVYTAQGKLEELGPWAFAAQCCGMHLATELGEPITLKYLKTAGLGQPVGDWDPLNSYDQRRALDGALLFGEPHNGRYRIVRGYSTYIQDDNLAKTDINVWEIRNYLRRRYRKFLEQRFGGRAIGATRPGVRYSAPASRASILEYMSALLEEDRQNGYIIDSQDEDGNWIHAWSQLVVQLTGDVGVIKVRVYPKLGLNFITVDFDFQMARFG